MLRVSRAGLVLMTGLCISPLASLAATYQVGGCKAGLKNFTTISAAVAGVPAGSTIDVCPGVYPEQVTITQPLSLVGVSSGNANRAVIAINPNGILTPNVTSVLGPLFYAQVLVQTVAPAGPVNITGITVDGTNGPDDCTTGNNFAAIFYAKGTTGIVNEVTTRNQVSCQTGVGIWVENTGGPTTTVKIENSSVRNFDDFGISAASDQNPTTITATIEGNFLNDGSPGSFEALGIYAEGAGGTISNNVITGSFLGIADAEALATNCCPVTITGNFLADMIGDGITVASGSTLQANKVSHVNVGLNLRGAVTAKSNVTFNTQYAAQFNCVANGGVRGNIFNDSLYGFDQSPTPVTGNPIYNIDTVQSGTCP